MVKRRDFLSLGASLPLAAWKPRAAAAGARVAVIGGGYGGATAASYVALARAGIDVTLVEPAEAFVSCPLSNLVLGGSRSLAEVTRGYDGLRKHGIRVLHERVLAVDAAKRSVRFASGASFAYDRLVVSPGIDFMLEEVEGYAALGERVLHAWKAGPQTIALRRQIEEIPDGGVYLLAVPMLPYRCPPAPDERACPVAGYFKRAKPRAKVLVLDANQEITSEAAHFQRAWEELYPGMVDYRPNSTVVAVERGAVRTDFETVKGDVLNVVPPQRAADIAVQAGLITHNKRWCDVDWRTMESTAVRYVHVLGDATLPASAMPKSGHMAHDQGKVCAAAIVALLNGRPPPSRPEMTSTCYSFVSDSQAVHLSSRHRYDAAEKTMVQVKGSVSVSSERSAREAAEGLKWAREIWADMLE